VNFSQHLQHSYVTSLYAQIAMAHKRIHMTHVPDAVAPFVPAMQAGHERIMQALHDHQIAIDPYPTVLPKPLAHHPAAAKAYPMQGILKYHGLSDWDQRIAYLPSVSLNSDAAHTLTYVEFCPELSQDDVWIGDTPALGRERERVVQTLDGVRAVAGVTWPARVRSRNVFRAKVAGKGLGSSASGSAALAVATIAALFGDDMVQNQHFVSCMARLLAGSGCRAAVGGIALWLSYPGASHADSFAVRLDRPQQFDDVALLTVPVASRIGLKTEQAHADAPHSSLFTSWMLGRSDEVVAAIAATRRGDWQWLGRYAEIDSMRLHGITMSGGDDYKIIGWESENIALFRMCNDLRAHGIPVYCSTDTGPTAVFMMAKVHETQVADAIAACVPGAEIIHGQIAGPAHLVDLADARHQLGIGIDW
jgi:diphosphomevalonate decarboxylase